MADFLEGTTIGGSIAITEKNIYDYLDDIIADTSIDRLAPKTTSFEEYIKAFNITDLNTLSPSRDIGLYITTGVTTPDANIYGTYEIPVNLKTGTWTNTQSKLDVAKYNLTKSPMADKSLLFIFNNDFDPTINKITLMCYHIDSGVWYRMNQIKGTDKLSKKWEVDLQVQLHYDNMRKLSNVIDNLFSDKMDKSKNLSDVVNVTEARRNLNIALTDVVGTGLSTLYSSQKLSKVIDDKVNANVIVTNEVKDNLTKTDGKLADTITDLNKYKVDNDKNILDTKTTLQTNINTKITGGSVVQTIGTSTVNVMSQKAIRDYTDSVGDANGKFMREGAYGLGQDGFTKYDVNPDNEWGGFMNIHMASLDKDAPKGTMRYASLSSFNNKQSSFRSQIQVSKDRMWIRGASTEWHEILSESNTITDKNNVLYSGTSTPLDSLNTSNIVTTTGTSTVNAMSQKTVTDELNKRPLYGEVKGHALASNGVYLNSASSMFKLEAGTFGLSIGEKLMNIDNPSTALGDSFVNFEVMENYNGSGKNSFVFFNGYTKPVSGMAVSRDGGDTWSEVAVNLSTYNTSVDNSGFLRSSGNKHTFTTDKVVQVGGTSTVNVPSQKYVTDEFKKVNDNLDTVIDTTVVDLEKKINTKITGGSVVQVEGTSTVNVPSQKYVTDEFKKVNDNLNTVIDTTVVGLKADIAKKWDIQTTTGTGNVARMSEVEKKADTTYVNTELGKKRDLNDKSFINSVSIYSENGGSIYGLSEGGIPFVSIKVGAGSENYANFPNKSGTIALTSDIPALSGYATQSWVNGRGYTTLGTANANSTKLGAELVVSHTISGGESAQRERIMMDAMLKVPTNSVITRLVYDKDGHYPRGRAFYRPITRL